MATEDTGLRLKSLLGALQAVFSVNSQGYIMSLWSQQVVALAEGSLQHPKTNTIGMDLGVIFYFSFPFSLSLLLSLFY